VQDIQALQNAEAMYPSKPVKAKFYSYQINTLNSY